MVLRTDYADGGATPTTGSITASDMNAISTAVNDAATLTGIETFTNKTLTQPRIDEIKNTAVGNVFMAAGTHTVRFYDPTSGEKGFQFSGTTSAANYVATDNSVSGVSPRIGGEGTDTNVGLRLGTQGSGIVSARDSAGNYREVANIDGPQTFTNKTVTAPVLSGTATGTYTLGGTPTISSPTVTGLAATDGIAAVNLPNGITNGNTARQSQAVVSGTSYYIIGSNLNLPATLKAGMAAGTRFRWRVAMDKTAAGTGAFAIEIRRGTNGTTADTADVSQSVGTQTAVIDNMVVDVEMVVTTTGATGAYYWTIVPVNTISSTTTAAGFGVPKHTASFFAGTVSSVAMNTASLKFGLSFKATTGTPTITIPMVRAEALNIC